MAVECGNKFWQVKYKGQRKLTVRSETGVHLGEKTDIVEAVKIINLLKYFSLL